MLRVHVKKYPRAIPRRVAHNVIFHIRFDSASVYIRTLELTQLERAFFLSFITHETLFSSSSFARDVPFSLFSIALLSLSFYLFSLKPGSRDYREFYDPLRRRKLEISHVKVETTGRAGRGTRKVPRDVGGCDRGKVTKIRAKATAEWLSHPPRRSPPPRVACLAIVRG